MPSLAISVVHRSMMAKRVHTQTVYSNVPRCV